MGLLPAELGLSFIEPVKRLKRGRHHCPEKVGSSGMCQLSALIGRQQLGATTIDRARDNRLSKSDRDYCLHLFPIGLQHLQGYDIGVTTALALLF